MINYYECHITMEGVPAQVRPYVESYGWKFSAIDGDIVSGPGIKCYATYMYSCLKPEDWCVAQLKGVASQLESHGIKILRRKMERVIFDDKIGSCNGDCCVR